MISHGHDDVRSSSPASNADGKITVGSRRQTNEAQRQPTEGQRERAFAESFSVTRGMDIESRERIEMMRFEQKEKAARERSGH